METHHLSVVAVSALPEVHPTPCKVGHWVSATGVGYRPRGLSIPCQLFSDSTGSKKTWRPSLGWLLGGEAKLGLRRCHEAPAPPTVKSGRFRMALQTCGKSASTAWCSAVFLAQKPEWVKLAHVSLEGPWYLRIGARL